MRHKIRGLLAVLFSTALAHDAVAYTSAGDRTFAATVILPQIAPSDEFYVTPSTLPGPGGTRPNEVALNYTKTITERLGVLVGSGYSWIDQSGAPMLYGWQNITAQIQYLAVQDMAHEFLLSIGVEREFGRTGALAVGANPRGATTPTLYFGKGLGDAALPFLRPLAVLGVLGYSKADGNPRADQVTAGLALEYSIPYLESKVRPLPLPGLVRALIPMVEVSYTTPAGNSFGSKTTGLVAPGLTYAGDGYELAVEAQFPTTRATGRGVGVIAQAHFSLDFFFPDSLGTPLFGGP